MKLSNILVLVMVIALGLGLAVGNYVAPVVQNLGAGFKTDSADSASLSPENDGAADKQKSAHSGSGISKQDVSSPKDLATILKETNLYDRMKDFTAYADSLQPEKILDAVREFGKGANDDNRMAAILISRLAASDPQAVLAEAKHTQVSWLKRELLNAAFGALAAQDSASAISQAQQLSDQDERSMALEGIIGQMVQQNPAQAFALSQTMKNDVGPNMTSPWNPPVWRTSIFTSVMDNIFKQWALRSPGEATQAALQLSDEWQRTYVIGLVEQVMGRQGSASALAWLNQLPAGPARDIAEKDVALDLSTHDSQALAGYLNTLPSDKHRSDLITMVALTWAESDPQTAFTLLGSVPPAGGGVHFKEQQNELMMMVAGKWAESDPKAAFDYITALPVQTPDAGEFVDDKWRANDNWIGNVFEAWGGSDPQAALAAINQLPEGGHTKEWAFDRAMVGWSGQHPADAAAYVLSMPEGDAQQAKIGMVAGFWVAKDPVSAEQWAAKIPDGQLKNSAYASMAGSLAQNDPIQATAWLTQLPVGSSKDVAIQSFSSQFFANDPERAVQWATTIGDPKTQQAQVTTLLQKWMQLDPTNASAAVKKSSLPDDVKNQLLQAKR